MAKITDRLPNLAKEFFIKYLNKEFFFPRPSGINNGKKIINSDNMPEPLVPYFIPIYSVWLQTPSTNKNIIYIGGASVDENSCKLLPNSNGFIDISDLSKLFVYGKKNDVINYVYTY